MGVLRNPFSRNPLVLAGHKIKMPMGQPPARRAQRHGRLGILGPVGRFRRFGRVDFSGKRILLEASEMFDRILHKNPRSFDDRRKVEFLRHCDIINF